MNIFKKCGIFSLLALIIVSLISQQASAIGEGDYLRNGIDYYQKDSYSCSTGSTTADVNLTGSDNAQKAWNYFASKGLYPIQIAGILGNLQHESGIDPTIIEGGKHSDNPADAGSGGYGIMQWTPGKKLLTILSQIHASSPPNSLSAQLDATWGAIQGNEPGYWSDKSFLKKFNAQPDTDSATQFYMNNIEHPLASAAALGQRQKYAASFLKLYGGTTTTLPPTSSSNPSTTTTSGSSSCGGSDDLGYDGSKRPGQWTEADIFKGHVNYQQCDPAWANTTVANGATTICHSACGPFSMANIIQNFGYNVDPSKLAIEAGQQGVLTANGSTPIKVVKYFAPKYNLRYDVLPAGNVAALKSALTGGAQVILAGRGADPWIANVGHIESLWQYNQSDDTFYVSDPGNQTHSKAWPTQQVLAGAYNYGGESMPSQLAIAVYKQ